MNVRYEGITQNRSLRRDRTSVYAFSLLSELERSGEAGWHGNRSYQLP